MSSRLWLAVRFGGKFPPPVIRFLRLEHSVTPTTQSTSPDEMVRSVRITGKHITEAS